MPRDRVNRGPRTFWLLVRYNRHRHAHLMSWDDIEARTLMLPAKKPVIANTPYKTLLAMSFNCVSLVPLFLELANVFWIAAVVLLLAHDVLPSPQIVDGAVHAHRAEGHETENDDLSPWRIIWVPRRSALPTYHRPNQKDSHRTLPRRTEARSIILGALVVYEAEKRICTGILPWPERWSCSDYI